MPETKKTVFVGILHDSYKDENGKEIKYTGQIAGIWETKEIFSAVDFDGFTIFHLSKEEFKSKDCKEDVFCWSLDISLESFYSYHIISII